jgi:hypothetical protein
MTDIKGAAPMTDEELRKEVFAWYGSVAYSAQCFEIELGILLSAHNRLISPTSTPEELDELFAKTLLRKTLGQLMQEIRKRFEIHPDFEALLAMYLEKRNYIAHRFFFENARKLLSAEGCKQLIDELQSLYATFREADEISKVMSKNLRLASGVDEAALQELVNREIKSWQI